MPRIIDVSLGIGPDLVTWPTDPGISIERVKLLEEGDSSNVSEVRLGSHTGTHVDPPVHFITGADAIDALPLETFYGPALVADLTAADSIGPRELDALRLDDGV